LQAIDFGLYAGDGHSRDAESFVQLCDKRKNLCCEIRLDILCRNDGFEDRFVAASRSPFDQKIGEARQKSQWAASYKGRSMRVPRVTNPPHLFLLDFFQMSITSFSEFVLMG
jgi:hypothetical protein